MRKERLKQKNNKTRILQIPMHEKNEREKLLSNNGGGKDKDGTRIKEILRATKETGKNEIYKTAPSTKNQQKQRSVTLKLSLRVIDTINLVEGSLSQIVFVTLARDKIFIEALKIHKGSVNQ